MGEADCSSPVVGEPPELNVEWGVVSPDLATSFFVLRSLSIFTTIMGVTENTYGDKRILFRPTVQSADEFTHNGYILVSTERCSRGKATLTFDASVIQYSGSIFGGPMA